MAVVEPAAVDAAEMVIVVPAMAVTYAEAGIPTAETKKPSAILVFEATVIEVEPDDQVPVVEAAVPEGKEEDDPLPLLKLSVKMVVCAMPIKGSK